MRHFFMAMGLAVAAPASAEVVSSSPGGFVLRHSVQLVVPVDRAYTAIGELPRWWSKDHTYSGDSANLSLTMRPGGCFCETLEKGGGIEHMRVVLVQPGERLVMTGGLGPLLYEGVAGVMDLKVERIAGGSRVTMEYRAAGFAGGGGEKLAPLVDKVLGEQLRRYREHLSRRPRG